MITIKEIQEYLNTIAPFKFQEDYDNAGLLIGNPNMICTGVMTCLDSTEAVIDEAIAKRCNLVLAHHPIIFRGLKRITGATYIERVILKAIKNDIAIIAIHTNLDNVIKDGVNGTIARKLELTSIEALHLKQDIITDEYDVGSGIVGLLQQPMDGLQFLLEMKQKMNVSTIKHTALIDKKISKVAICGGAGSFLLPNAIAVGADVFITSDFKYHEYFDADNKIIIADIGHYESEQFTINLLCDIIQRKFSTFAAHCTNMNTNPVNYL